LRNICCQSTVRNLHAATTFYNLQLSAAKGIIKVFCTQPQQRGTWTQPFHGDLPETELQNKKELRTTATQIAAPKPISTPKRKNDDS